MDITEMRKLPGYRASMAKALQYIPTTEEAEAFLLERVESMERDKHGITKPGEVSDDLLRRVIHLMQCHQLAIHAEWCHRDGEDWVHDEMCTEAVALIQELERVQAAR